MAILITGSAGFIGFSLTKRIIEMEIDVICIDIINDYYSTELKDNRIKELYKVYSATSRNSKFEFLKIDLCDQKQIEEVFFNHNIDVVIHLAAQAGVRYSIENPRAYINSNIIGFFNILEESKKNKVNHFLYASSSSIYGLNKTIPFSTNDLTDFPISLYAATKKSNELLAHSYSHLYNLPTTGLRFFTVYGPWGRPDMAYFKFTQSIFNGKPIDVYNSGDLFRDFTYIDDIVNAIIKLFELPPIGGNSKNIHMIRNNSMVPFQVFNIGNNKPVKLIEFISTLENLIGRKAIINNLEMQPGDVSITYANIDDLQEYCGFAPKTELNEGLKNFVKWYKEYYNF
jgi:UDP-glucuronate 4-epimerase